MRWKAAMLWSWQQICLLCQTIHGKFKLSKRRTSTVKFKHFPGRVAMLFETWVQLLAAKFNSLIDYVIAYFIVTMVYWAQDNCVGVRQGKRLSNLPTKNKQCGYRVRLWPPPTVTFEYLTLKLLCDLHLRCRTFLQIWAHYAFAFWN